MRKSQSEQILNCSEKTISDSFHFSHEAMATVYELYISCDDENYARQGAQAAFAEVDRLELEMSRFISNSDISRLNIAVPGQVVDLGIDTFSCLLRAKEMFEKTQGAFDISVGALYECWLDDNRELRKPSMDELDNAYGLTGLDLLKLDDNDFCAEVLVEGVKFDLGGIGKGYAAEKVAEILKEWSLKESLVLAGASSVLCVSVPEGMKGWPVVLRNPLDSTDILMRFDLKEGAISGSGRKKGQHIIDPRSIEAGPVTFSSGAWALAADAICADALSTAFMMFSDEEINEYCLANSGTAAIISGSEGVSDSTGQRYKKFGQI